MTTRLRELSLHSKLTLIFAGVMAIVLALVGSFLFYRTKTNLDDAIRQSLRSRAGDLTQSIRAGSNGDSPGNLIEPGERFAQVLTSNGRVLDSRPQNEARLLRLSEIGPHQRFVERHERTRLLVTPVRVDGRQYVAVVAQSLSDREHALEGLGRALLIGGPLALLLTSALAYWIGRAALHPVELMRRRAAEITAADDDARLPVPAAKDEIHRLAITLNAMLARLAGQAERQRAFVANASHELRTPIATIRTELELALRHAKTLEAFRSATGAAIADADDLARLAADLLVLAQVDRTGVPLQLQDTELDPILRIVASELEHDPLLAERRVVCSPTGLRAHADPDRLTQAVRNMARNALVHGSGAITLGAESRDGGVTVWADDEGGRLPEHLPDSAFERFVRGSDAGGLPGAGLGLAIVKEVATAHRGTARLMNTPSGVRCSIHLPSASPKERRPPIHAASPGS